MTAARAVAVLATLATLALAVLVLLSSRFAPAPVEQLNAWLPEALRSDWFNRLLPREWRVYSILIWVLAAFALLSVLDRIVATLRRR